MPGSVFHALHDLWLERERRDEYFGTLINAYLANGGEALGVKAGEVYVDVGTLQGYRTAMTLLDGSRLADAARPSSEAAPATELRS
jgi:hypothetical protein